MSKFSIDWNKVKNQIKEEETKTSYKKKEVDKRFLTPDVSKEGYAEVRLRLLPSPDTDIPYVKVFNHGFRALNKQWYIENCPTTFGEKCPVCEENGRLWNTGSQANKDIAIQRSRKMSVFVNVLVIKDPNHPENEGKVMLWRYGKGLHEKIMNKINPKKGSVDEPVMVFDPENGADFKLKVKRTSFVGRNGEQVQSLNYDTSEFAPQSALTPEQIKIAESGVFNLSEFLDRSEFKSYDQLKNLFNKKLGLGEVSRVSSDNIPADKQVDDSAADDSAPAPEGMDSDDETSFLDSLRKKASN
jgi:hypothetical protein